MKDSFWSMAKSLHQSKPLIFFSPKALLKDKSYVKGEFPTLK